MSSTLSCLHCGARTSNGLVLCARHLHGLRETLAGLAAYYADVDRLQPGARLPVRRAIGWQPPTPGRTGDRISAALSDAENTLTTWCRALAEDRDVVAPAVDLRDLAGSIGRCAAWLGSHATTIATLEWAAECLRDLRRAAAELRRLLDEADTGRFIGRCDAEVGLDSEGEPVRCGRGLYAVEGESWKVCPECGHSHDVEAKRAALRRATADRLAPLRVVARAVVALTGEPSLDRVTRRIEKWVERGQLADYGLRHFDDGSGPDPVARRHYRIGDVLALIDRDTRRIEAGYLTGRAVGW